MSWLERSRARRPRRADRSRPREPRAVRRPRLGDGAGLQPHDHAARVAARSRDAGALGHRRLSPAVRPRARGHVAARVRGRYRVARGARRRGHRVHRARAASGEGVARRRAASGARRAIDPGRAYRCALPSGRSIDLFFYDGATAQAVAFERLLADGHQIIARMTARGHVEGGGPTLCHIATDGETYGHHHRYGDMALAWALSQVEARLERHAPHQLRRVSRARARRRGRSSSPRTRRGAARTASRAGATTAAATAAAGPAGTRSGGGRCATRSTGCAIRRRRALDSGRRACCSAIRGRRATRTSTCCSIAARRRAIGSSPTHARTSARRGRARARAVADGDGAPRDAHVHELRLVLRRSVGDRDRAVHAVRGARRRADRGRSAASPVEPELVDRLSAGALEPRGRGRRPRGVAAARAAGADRSGEGRARTSRCTRSSSPTRAQRVDVHGYHVELVDRVERRSRPRADDRGHRPRAVAADRGRDLAVLRRAVPRRAARHRRRASAARAGRVGARSSTS